MNSTPLDSSFQYASWEQKKILPRFFRLREIHKKNKKPQKTHIFGSHTNKWGLWPELSLRLNSTYPIQQLTAIWFESATNNFFEKTMNPYLLSNLHPEKTFKQS
jgi:hypothetical protein